MLNGLIVYLVKIELFVDVFASSELAIGNCLKSIVLAHMSGL